MVSDLIYDLCRPVLADEALGEEEKVDRLEELLGATPTSLRGKALEDAVLGALWQWKSAAENSSSPPPARGANIIRSRSPASWIPRSGTNSPRPASATPSGPPGFNPLTRTRSSAASPFPSPRASPRLSAVPLAIPNSPRLAYQYNGSSPTTEPYGDHSSDMVDWLGNDDTSSNTSYGDFGFSSQASDFVPPSAVEMSPYDMLRSILQDDRSDEELEQILEANGYDFGQTIATIMEAQGGGQTDQTTTAIQSDSQNRTILVGKSMSPETSRSFVPSSQQKSSTVCRYWLASGRCARADCRFAHEVQNHVCKYWLAGNCIAGNTCLFSHDPAALMQQLSLASSGSNTPQPYGPDFQLQDYDSFPALQPSTSNPYEDVAPVDSTAALSAAFPQQFPSASQAAGYFPTFVPAGPRHGSRPNSRPGSRHNSRAPTPSQPNFQDDEAFPTLGSAAASKQGKRHHGKRGGHGHHNTTSTPNNLADVVRMSPSPVQASREEVLRRGLRNNRSFTSTRENSTAAAAIPAPTEIPWLETGPTANHAYLKARQEAFKHGGLRNKFLQSAAQAWNRNDARGAKALSLRGQNENSLMREKHREAARALYEERNKHRGATGAKDLYVDLHGLHPEEAVSYLSDCLKEQQGRHSSNTTSSSRPVYAICGTGHHSKNGKDKVGKAVRSFLNEWRYAFREFSVPGDRSNVGGILGIDPASYDRGAMAGAALKAGSASTGDGDSGVGLEEGKGTDTKVLVVKDDPRKAIDAGGDEKGDEDSEE